MAYTPNYYGGYYQPNYYPNNGAMPDMLSQQKMSYQPHMAQPMPQQPINVTAPSNDFLWVLSRNEAESYPVAPNSTVTLWDKSEPVIYIKSANAQGVPSMRVLDFTERTATTPPKSPASHECQCGGKYATKEDFEALKKDFTELKGIFEKSSPKTSASITKEDYD